MTSIYAQFLKQVIDHVKEKPIAEITGEDIYNITTLASMQLEFLDELTTRKEKKRRGLFSVEVPTEVASEAELKLTMIESRLCF